MNPFINLISENVNSYFMNLFTCVVLGIVAYMEVMKKKNPALSILSQARAEGINLSDLCREANIDRSTIEKWGDNPNPKWSTLESLERALHKLSKGE